MLAAHRLQSLRRPVIANARAFATILTTDTTVPEIPGTDDVSTSAEVAKTQGRRRRKIPPQRPNISLTNPREWNRPIKPGVVPAYDLSLAVLRRDSEQLKDELKLLREKIAQKEQEYTALKEKNAPSGELETLDEELEALMKKANIIEVQSEINLPDVRWTVNNAMADMSKPSHRHLVEQKWRKDGDLDLQMERLHQMSVVPDVLPDIRPSLDLHVVVRATPSVFLKSGKTKVLTHVEPGSYLRPKQTIEPPSIRVNVFHTDTRLYTMLFVDPDVPHPESQSYDTFLHWMVPNIPLSATSSVVNLKASPENTTPYVPPHPQRGSPYHRYTILLLPQPPLSKYSLTTAARATGPTSQHLDIPIVPENERIGFDVREFAEKWGLDASTGGGAHMFRQVWDEDVSRIYNDVLKVPEPRYSRPPKFNVYEATKGRKKYNVL